MESSQSNNWMHQTKSFHHNNGTQLAALGAANSSTVPSEERTLVGASNDDFIIDTPSSMTLK